MGVEAVLGARVLPPGRGSLRRSGGNSGGDGQGEQRKGLGAAGAELRPIYFSKRDLNGDGKPRERIIWSS